MHAKVYGFAFLISIAISYLTTPLLEKIAFKLGAVDIPDEHRKIHTRPTPRIGGVAIYLAAVIAWAASAFYLYFSDLHYLINFRESLTIFLGASLVALIGVADDFRSLSPLEKFIGQIIASSVLLFFGLGIDFIALPFVEGTLVLGYWSIPFTLFWMVAMMNVINFIDGLDGLAAGVSSISAFTFFFYLVSKGKFGMAIIAVILAGACLGFLRYNFYPARIFMGDSGSMFIGYLLGAIAIQGVMKSVAAIALLVPIVIVGVPIIDTFFAIVRRYAHRQPLTVADRGHIHHRLLHRGLGHRGAVFVIYVWSALLAGAGYAMGYLPTIFKWGSFVALGALSLVIVWYTGLIDELRLVILERMSNNNEKNERQV